jgi:hypothetical protein
MSNLKISLVFEAINKLTAPIKAISDSISGLSGKTTNLNLSNDKLSEALGTTGKTVTDTSGKVKKSEASVTALTDKTTGLTSANDKLSKAFRATGSEAASVASRVGQATGKFDKAKADIDAALQRGMAAKFVGDQIKGVGQSVINPLQEAVFVSGNFQENLAGLGKVSGATKSELIGVQSQLVSLVGPTNQSADALLSATSQLVANGLALDDARASIYDIGRTATASDSDILSVSNTVFALQKNLKVKPTELTQALDELAAAGKAGAFELKDMAQYFPALTAKAEALSMTGLDGVRSIAAALQVARFGAGSSATAALNMENFLAKLTAPDTIKRFEEMGVSVQGVFEDAIASGLNPVEAMLDQIQELTDGDQFKLGELFQDMQVKAFLTPMIANMEKFKEIKEAMVAGKGTIDSDFERSSDTWNFATKEFSNTYGRFKLALGTPMLTGLAIGLSPLIIAVKALTWLAELSPILTGGLGILLGALGGLLVVGGSLLATVVSLAGAFLIVKVAIPLLVSGLVSIAAAGWAAVAPFWPIIALVGLFAGAAFLVYKYWEPIKGFFVSLWNGILSGFEQVKGILSWFGIGGDQQIEVTSGSNKTGRGLKSAVAGATLMAATPMAAQSPAPQAMQPLTQAPRQSITMQGDKIDLHISGNGDPQAVAAEVRKVLDARDREKAVRRRSQLSDID